MKTPFKVSINRSHSSHDGDRIHFQIESLSGGLYVEFEMELDTFAQCITGLSRMESLIGNVYGSTDRIHKVRIWKSYKIKGDFDIPYKNERELAYKILLEQPEVQKDIADGWILGNNFSSKGDIDHQGIMAKFDKWVPVDQIPEEFQHLHKPFGIGYDVVETLKECMEKK